MNLSLDEELAWRLLISFCIGTAIGFEREYRSKAAGLRTMIMICLGSTIFTELSILISPSSPDRIASTIVTGIGFLGAGVIFKDGLTVTGITTATTIWISAALGMAVGMGQYFIAIFGLVGVLIVLAVFEKLQLHIERMHQTRTYRVKCHIMHASESPFGTIPKELGLTIRKKKELKENESIIMVFEISGKETKLDAFNLYLRNEQQVLSFEY
ncbi:MAG TPA: MgtC/SapB family protein [Cyclobacteriaceae bacterium]|nr:MgtC/SapB family protein [Cyclobacteriaceae bacterium]